MARGRTRRQIRADHQRFIARQNMLNRQAQEAAAQREAQQAQIPDANVTTGQGGPAAFTPTIFGQRSETLPTGTLRQFPRFTPQQQTLQQQFLNQLMPLLQQLSEPADISNIISQRRRAFETETIPSLLERLGSGPTAQAQRSSALGGTLGAAGSGLEQDLASLQSQVRLSDLGRLQKLFGGLGGLGFEPQYDRSFFPSRPGFGEQFGSSFSSGLGGGLGGLFGALPRMLAGLFF